MHVTLINPPYPSGAPKSTYVPMGISYLAAFLEKNGFTVNIIDFQTLQTTIEKFRENLRDYNPSLIGITSATLTFNSAIQLARIAKETCPESLIVMGGPHVTVMDKETLEECVWVDVVVRGEGEQTLLELAQLKKNSNLEAFHKVLGITFRKNGKIFRTPDRPFIQDLEMLPFPAFNLLSLEKYRLFGKTYLPIITSRGCPFHCTFCLAWRLAGRKFRARGPNNVLMELELLRDKYGADAVTFYDDTFTFDRERTRKICEEMKRRNFKLPWDCRTRVDSISENLLALMRAANCQLIHFGVESGSQKILNAMRKGTTVEQNERAIKWAKKAGILVAVSVIIGYPGENENTIKETMDFIKKTEPDYVYVCVPTPYPGTELYDHIKNLGWKISANWDHYDEQTPVFVNPYLPAEKLRRIRREFYNRYFSPLYVLHKSFRNDFYSRIMARVALNDLLWRIKIPKLISSSIKKLATPS
ncbi:MAG: radical SAM protein [Candidatus Bathyarchaeia archaeon]